MMTAQLTMDQAKKISSPAIRNAALHALQNSGSADGVIDALNYDKYTHDKSSECICVLGGL
ncbi:MAG: hypothetical protein ACRC75_00380 [Olsenella sp.]|jgi:hypothetical protein